MAGSFGLAPFRDSGNFWGMGKIVYRLQLTEEISENHNRV